ncbi:hypothetical protein T440DRAFT_543382 [Plenodomus tracheiphilus IPT5]|uniref:BTB domain-containing protein n=1 Tax=Plenodomus tracheiphilus IPT5 TaxID=1408161 RepID=A0A6A7AR21_9PLEO|nr:hypothetical protein T440DRAFT_543382 [Plenodomus tracheiphilus IPT5]
MAPSKAKHDKRLRPRISHLTRLSAKNAVFATVIVGANKDQFTVHKSLLVHHSPFFGAALIGNFKEAEKKEVVLLDTLPQTFEFFVHWAYHGRFPDANDDKELYGLWKDAKGEDDRDLEFKNVLRLYILCEEYDISVLKRTAIDGYFDLMDGDGLDYYLLDPEMITEAFKNLPEKSAMCQLLVDASCKFAMESMWIDHTKFPCSFIAKVLKLYSEGVYDLEEDDDLKRCDYHEHRNDEEGKACESKNDDMGVGAGDVVQAELED